MEPSDYPFLYRQELAASIVHRWRWGASTPSPEDYPTALWRGVYAQYLTTAVGSDQRILGIVTAYNLDSINGYCYLATVRFMDGLAAAALHLEGCAVFIDFVFSGTPIRKMYFEAPEYNLGELRSLLQHGVLIEESRLKEHRYFDGKHWDYVTLSLYRESWTELRLNVPGLSPPKDV